MYIDSKIKKSYREALESFYQTYQSKSDFIDTKLFNLMIEITDKTGYEVAVVISRKGFIEDIFVGDKSSVSLPKPEVNVKGYNGFRVVHTHPNGNGNLSQLDKSALINSKYDTVCAVGVLNGHPTNASAGFVKATEKGMVADVFNLPHGIYINKYGLLERIEQSEKDFIADSKYLKQQKEGVSKAILVMVELSKNDDIVRDLDELESLCETAGVEVVGRLTQKRDKPDGKYFIGAGKLEELKELIQNLGANTVVFDNELTGSKQANLAKELGVHIVDRSMIILDIFAKRARTSEGKLQVELAQLKYFLPRSNNLARGAEIGSGVGMRGPGESKLEINRRIIENNILKLERELEQVKRSREVSRTSRMKGGKTIVSLVGYTNSGKSTLMNALSGANVYEKDELFATLDTTTRNVYIDDKNQILLIDTVGFINKLPHEFINAFSSTLEESVHADLLLHVVDASNKDWEKQMQVVLDVLQKIKVKSPILTVFNKVDKVKDKTPFENFNKGESVIISAKKLVGLENLKQKIVVMTKNK